MVFNFFMKKARLRAVFIDEVGLVSERKVKYSNNTFSVKVFGEPQAYVVDHNFVTYDRKNKMPVSFYYTNNPNPIRIQHERNKEVDGIGFKKILDSKVITDLFSDEAKNVMTLIMVLIIAILGLLVVSLLLQFHVIKI